MINRTFAQRYPVAWAVMTLDLVVVVISAFLAHLIRFHEIRLEPNYQVVTLILALLVVLSGAFLGIYGSWRGMKLAPQLYRVVLGWLIAFSILFGLLFFAKIAEEFSRAWLGILFLLGVSLACFYKTMLFLILRWVRKSGHNIKHVVIVGRSSILEKTLKELNLQVEYGFNVIGIMNLKGGVDDIENRSEDLFRIVNSTKADEVWICLPLREGDYIKHILFALRHSTVEIRYIPDLEDLLVLNHRVSNIAGFYAIDLSCSPLDGISHYIKRAEDLIIGMLIFILVLPIGAVIAIAIKGSSPGPVFYKQKRHGIGGRKISVLKFRTMIVHEEANGTVTQASKNDARVTSVGGFLRRTSLDELPQFFNVLQGRMSIVGPRPHALAHNEYYKELVESYMWRHKVKPGITGWAQVHGYRGETDTLEKMQKRIKCDLWYIENWSLRLDLKIIFLTVIKGFVGKNVH